MTTTNLLKFALVFCIVMVISFLLGAFVSASFDITVWSHASRYFTAMLGALFAIFGGLVSIQK